MSAALRRLGFQVTTGVRRRLRLVIPWDACRNNPLARSMQRTLAGRSPERGRLGDLNEDLLGDETLVAYAAVAGVRRRRTAGSPNSPYTSALLAHLEQPLEIAGLLFMAGMRRSEVSALRWADVDDAADDDGILVTVRRSKSSKRLARAHRVTPASTRLDTTSTTIIIGRSP